VTHGNFGFPVLIKKNLNLKNYFANFVENCKIYSKEVLVNDINGINHYDNFSRSYDDLYLGVITISVPSYHVGPDNNECQIKHTFLGSSNQ